MKLLLAVSSVAELTEILPADNLKPAIGEPYVLSTDVNNHEVTVAIIGYSNTVTTHRTTKILTASRYHLAIKAGYGRLLGDLPDDIIALNIVNEKNGDEGYKADGKWQSYYDLNLMNREEPPHVRGGIVNLTNSYLNVFLPYRKAVGVTANRLYEPEMEKLFVTHHLAKVQTTNGAGFAYACLAAGQPYYHLCIGERQHVFGKPGKAAAEHLRQTLQDVLEKI
ncbi:MAG: hypothetical protein NZM35_08795 [Chitinophagales bacterium]|nr:hypothetical protein [Chitinophagales bacterium]MDW8419325.1 hypothetical protein [Chitinophagales bacterium]